MRFRKTITICKGVRLNVSKSGVSATVGPKGLSLNLGKNGVFLNTGIPGTGLYDRHRLTGGKKKKGAAAGKKAEEALDVSKYQLVLQEDGDVDVFTADGNRAPAEEVRRLKKTDWYEEQYDDLMDEFREMIEKEQRAFIAIHEQACRVGGAGAPDTADELEAKLDDWLENLELPMEFDLQYEYDEALAGVMLDLDLPEIEDVPDEKAVEMADGAVKAKQMSLKELREAYRSCVFGLAVYFASHVFRIGGGVKFVLVSGYTQRRDRKGDMGDRYIYSVVLERGLFEEDSVTRADPFDFCQDCPSRLNCSTAGELKEIEPYTREEFAEICEEMDD